MKKASLEVVHFGTKEPVTGRVSSEVYVCWHFHPDVYVSLEPDARV